MYEGLAHLLCEPLFFTLSEFYFDKAERIYEEEKDLSKILKYKFQLKKASYLKKSAFFFEGNDLLDKMEKEILEEIEFEEN